MKHCFCLFSFLFSLCFYSRGQDAHFTQLNSAFLSVNPALTGVFDNHNNDSVGAYLRNRAIIGVTNRNQWQGSTSPFSSWQAQMNIRLGSLEKNINEGNLENRFNIGLSVLQDKSLYGILKKNAASISLSYQLPLSKEQTSLGIGFNSTFSRRQLDVSGISFANQFTSYGFDVNNISSGESGILNAKSFISLSTGLLLSCRSIGSKRFFKIGTAIYNFNKPKESFLNDTKSFVPLRSVAHFSYINYRSVGKVETFGIYQQQAGTNDYVFGIVSDYFFKRKSDIESIRQNSFGLGVLYRHKDAVAPYFRLEINNLLIACSYDVTISDLGASMSRAQSLELTIQYRIKKK